MDSKTKRSKLTMKKKHKKAKSKEKSETKNTEQQDKEQDSTNGTVKDGEKTSINKEEQDKNLQNESVASNEDGKKTPKQKRTTQQANEETVTQNSGKKSLENGKPDEDLKDSDRKSGKHKKKAKKLQKERLNFSNERTYNHIRLLHRLMQKKDIYFLTPHTAKLFGRPFIVCVEADVTTANQFYELVWNQIKRFVHIKDFKPTIQGIPWDKVKDSKLPFSLKLTTRNGSHCSICPWNKFCTGCPLALSSKLVKLSDRQTVTIDWDPEVKDESYVEKKAKEIVVDKTVMEIRQKQNIPISLSDCFEEFTANEELTDDELWHCPKCKEFRQATKKITLWKIPTIVVIHLKRFHQVYNMWTKSHRLIKFPIHGLDFTPFIDKKNTTLSEPPVYELYAVLNHFGGLGSGHYTTYAINRDDTHWYCFDDRRCYQVDETKVETPAAYMLFYIKSNFDKKDRQEIGTTSRFPNCSVM